MFSRAFNALPTSGVAPRFVAVNHVWLAPLMPVYSSKSRAACQLDSSAVKSPKVHVRDSGLLHVLLGVSDSEAVLSHPVAGDSCGGFVIEQLLGTKSTRVEPRFYRAADGEEIDLVPELPRGETWVDDINSAAAPTLHRVSLNARRDISPA